MWCSNIEVVSNELLILINRLFTTVLLVALLFACQQMPENKIEPIQLERQTD